MAYTEIHFHLLPGIDDGPATMADAMTLAAAAAAEGTRTIIATPHVSRMHNRDVAALPAAHAELESALARAGVPVTVLLGGELAHHRVGSLTDPELDLIANGPDGARWLLLEAPLEGIGPDYTRTADELRTRGFGVVVAHPERSLAEVGESAWACIEHEIAAGSAMQVNAWSLAGVYGERTRKLALRILAAAPHAAVASDAHGSERLPSLGLALDALAREGDPLGGARMDAVPRALLEHGVPFRRPLAA